MTIKIVFRYRNANYPIYAYADHIYTVMTMATLLLAIALGLSSNPHWSDFTALFLITFIGGAIHGRFERNWILGWIEKDSKLSSPPQ
jgi:hypothetical protein